MKATLVLILASFLLPPLVAEDDELRKGADDNAISERIHPQPQDQPDGQPRSVEAAEATSSATSASQKVMEDESLTRLPPYRRTYHYNRHHGEENDRVGAPPFAWAPPEHVLQQHSNHNIVIPPFRPFALMDDNLRHSLERLTRGGKQQQQTRAQRRQSGLHRIRTNETTTQQQRKKKRINNETLQIRNRIPAIGRDVSSDQQHQHCGSDDALDAEATEAADQSNSSEKDEESIAPPLPEPSAEPSASPEGEAVGGEAVVVSETETDAKDTDEQQTPSEEGEEEQTKEQKTQEEEEERVVVDYAGKSAGALVIEKSSGWKGTSNLLTYDEDAYAMVPASEEQKSLIISLSEEILVKKVVLSNYERYSCNVKEFSISGSQTMATWADLGTYNAAPGRFGRQEFELQEKDQHWARYLKFKFLSHYGDEHYLTITQISVHGTTMQQGFHEHWEEQQTDDDEEEEIEKTQELGGEMGEELQRNDEAGDDGDVNATGAVSAPETGTTSELESPNMTSEVPLEEQHNESFYSSETEPEKARSMRQARGIDQNGYLLYNWVMPQPRIEYGCQWTVLPSASVTLHSTRARRSLAKIEAAQSTRVTTYAEIKIPTNFSLLSLAKSCMLTNEIISSASSLPFPPLEDSLWVAELQTFLRESVKSFDAGEIKGRLIRTPRTHLKLDSSADNQTQKVSSDTAEHETGSKVTNSAQDGEAASKQAAPAETIQDSSHGAPEQGLGAFPIDGPTLEFLLQKVPSASCLQELDITQYKTKSKPTQKSSASTGSSNNGHPSGGSEPIFKKLTDEIKSLQAALNHHEKYSRDAVFCYQRVLMDILLQAERDRVEHDERLEHLENILSGKFLYSFLCDMATALRTMFSAGQTYFMNLDYGEVMTNLALAIAMCEKLVSTGYYYYISERMFVHGPEICWSWFLDRVSFSSMVGFPVVLCMLLYPYSRYPRKQAALRSKLIESPAK